eukprot:374095_1
MAQKLRTKQDTFKQIKTSSDTTSKFVTEIEPHQLIQNEKKDQTIEMKNEPANTSNNIYSFGYRFYYHNFYKNRMCHSTSIPGFDIGESNWYLYGQGLNDPGNSRHNQQGQYIKYGYKSLFIEPKYNNIKEDILLGKPKNLNIIQYKNTLQKALMKYKAYKIYVGEGAKPVFEKVYGIKHGSPITLNHILSVLFYTNFTVISKIFSKTYRKISLSEDIESVKNRHKEYGHWGKLLRESVEVWGNFFDEIPENVNYFYHGISSKLILEGLQHRFSAPTSTTLQYSTAVMFANQGNGNGIVLTIAKNNYKSLNMHFNCVPWSDFPGEMEMLFLGGLLPLKVCGLTDIALEINLDEWIHSIQLFESSIKNERGTDDKILKKHKTRLEMLIKNYCNNENSNEIPLYIEQVFKSVLKSVHSIRINIHMFQVETFKIVEEGYYYSACGYKLLSHIFFEKNGNIKWNTFTKLFPKLKRIAITRYDPVMCEYRSSVEVNNKLVEKILLLFKQSRIFGVSICNPPPPPPPEKYIKKLMSKCKHKLSEQNLKCDIVKEDNPICIDKCCKLDVFSINAKNYQPYVNLGGHMHQTNNHFSFL